MQRKFNEKRKNFNKSKSNLYKTFKKYYRFTLEINSWK